MEKERQDTKKKVRQEKQETPTEKEENKKVNANGELLIDGPYYKKG